MTSLILQNAANKITRFNEIGQHYNLVADEIYRVRHKIIDPLADSYLPYIIAGLATFDMGRMLGYSPNSGNFVIRLRNKLRAIKPLIKPIFLFNIMNFSFQEHGDKILHSYEILSANGLGALHQDEKKHFHVGASKILHFLNPDLFIIIDSNAAQAFRLAHNVSYIKATKPGYTAERYVKCMKLAQQDISEYGNDKFKALELNTPTTRIYDKLAFITGSI